MKICELAGGVFAVSGLGHLRVVAVNTGLPPNTRFADDEGRQEWMRHLRRLQTLEIETIVPGHGEVCGKAEIARNIECLSGN